MIDVQRLISQNILIVILGPTGSGKTDLSIKLADLIPTEIISADSRQIYRELDIGTAKPNSEQLKKVKHHFIDIINPDENYNAGKFGKDARAVSLKILSKNKLPLITGGSGLYIKSLCEGLFDDDMNEEERIRITRYRKDLEERLKDVGRESLYKELFLVDPISAEKYNDMNPRRLIRALEYFYFHKIPISESHKKQNTDVPFEPIYFGIDFEREMLYKRINLRTELMWENGLVEETSQVLKSGYSADLNSLNTVGYKEAIDYIEGKISENEAIDLIKQNTRRYAKRQMTWFRKNQNINWINPNEIEPIEFIKNNFKNTYGI